MRVPLLVWAFGLGVACRGAPDEAGAPPPAAGWHVGAARVEVTPSGPIRLSGYAARGSESEGVAQPLFARTLALRWGSEEPLLLLAVDNAAVPGELVERVAARLAATCELPRERLCIASTHTHTGALLEGAIPNMFGAPVPDDQMERVRAYGAFLEDRLVEAAQGALAELSPGRLELARGTAGFAANRRTAGGPVDHALPVLAARDERGELVALVANYACHCTTLGSDTNRCHGDWAGSAALELEAAHPGAVALVTIGCGADANPSPRGTIAMAEEHGRELATEVERVLRGATAVSGPARAQLARLALPFDALPTIEQWQARAQDGGAVGYHARRNLARLERGEALETELDYPVQTWTLGDDLALVFLAGEVVVDYALRLGRELDAERLWVTAYANDVPCYIPSERVLGEGGYEAEGAMIYYDRPARLASGVEERIVRAVHAHLPAEFRTVLGVDVSRTQGIAPRTPEESRACFRTHPELEVELVASEPLVESPVWVDFGPDGRLWVVEMRDYPSGMDGNGKPGGRVKVLEDRDGDGRFEHASVFLDELPFPTGVLPYRDGAFVCAAPDVLFAADRDGDGRAEHVATVLTGFRTDNYQARVNSLTRGLDGWIYGASGLAGSTVRGPTGAEVALGSRDFRFRPATGELEPAAGLTQHGRCRDDFGEWFGCDNSTWIWHFPFPEEALRRNPHFAPPPAMVSIAVGDDPHRLFPASRILERFNDPEMAGRATSVCGLGIYRDDRLGAEFRGDAFACEPVHDLVHRLVLRDSGTTFAAERASGEEGTEFLASTDPWFRPVQAATGPDGALWIVDMYRFVIEHPRWIPEERLAELDVRAGADLGRIWRVRRRGEPLRAVPRLDRMSSPELVAALDCANGVQRDLAQTLLEERGDVFLELCELYGRAADPAVRAQALSTLAGVGGLGYVFDRALVDADPRVRRTALRGIERVAGAMDWSRQHALHDLVAVETDPRTRMEAVLAARALPAGSLADEALCDLLRSAQDPYLAAAVRTSLSSHLWPVLEVLLRDDRPGDRSLAAELLVMAVRKGDALAGERLWSVASAWREGGRREAAFELLAACLESVERELEREWTFSGHLAPFAADARAVLEGSLAQAGELDPGTALVFLGRQPEQLERDVELLSGVLAGSGEPALRRAALGALARLSSPLAARAVLGALDALGPALKDAALDVLLSRAEWAELVLADLEERPARRAVLDAARRQILLRHASPSVRERAARVLGAPARRDVDELLARYAGLGTLEASARRGAAVFERACAQCHLLEGVGKSIGPDLAAVTDRSNRALLVAVLDPNRAINAQYANYRLRTRDGRDLDGLVLEESASHVTLRTLTEDVRLLRADVESLDDTGLSLMPEGLESELPPQAMADLCAYLREVGEEPRSFPGNAPALVTPGADGTLVLPATACRIHGPSLVFEEPFRNLGYWSSADDRAVWDVELPAAAELAIELEYACDDGVAGNAFVLASDLGELRGTVAGTGGWPSYRTVELGRLALPAGKSRVTFRSDGPIRGALLDLRELRGRP